MSGKFMKCVTKSQGVLGVRMSDKPTVQAKNEQKRVPQVCGSWQACLFLYEALLFCFYM